ncbi:MAG: NUDIX hydrolase [archaeon]
MAYEKREKLHIVVALAVIRNPEGKYLVLKRHGGEIVGPGNYTVPGGKVEGNDSIEETLQKEAMEEAGVELLPGKVFLCDHTFVRPDGQTAKVFVYFCSTGDWTKAKAGEDFTDYKWVFPSELAEIPHFEIIERYLKAAEELVAKGFDLRKLHAKSLK